MSIFEKLIQQNTRTPEEVKQIKEGSTSFAMGSKRPVIIGVLCTLGFFAIAVGFLGFLNPEGRQIFVEQRGAFALPITVLLLFTQLVGLIGYWKMRKWGVYIYVFWFVVGTLWSLFIQESLNVTDSVLPVIFILAGFVYLKKMN